VINDEKICSTNDSRDVPSHTEAILPNNVNAAERTLGSSYEVRKIKSNENFL
jgi:hypothetical protein